MSEPEAGGPDAGQQAGTRAARNTLARAFAEIVGKLASLALFMVLGRKVGPSDLGAFVFAFAFIQLATVAIDQGYDRWMLRHIARERSAANTVVGNVLRMKLAATVPVAALALLVLELIGPTHTERVTVYALAGGLMVDAFSRTVFAAFSALERSELLAAALIVQRVLAAALGIAALAAGYGVVTVALTYTAGAVAGFVLALALLRRSIGALTPDLNRATGGVLTRASLPFAVQDVFSVIIFRVDAVLLAIIATSAAVGRYGAAYRLFESTFFVSISVVSAFSAMYTYLGPDSVPTVASVFQRSIKAVITPLMPIAIAFAILATPICRLFFGAGLENAAAPLRILAPSVVLLGVVTLSASLYVSRRGPGRLVAVTAGMAALNLAGNLILIPLLDDRGAAAAMTITEAFYCAIALWMAVRTVGGVGWLAMLASPLAAAAVAAPVMLALQDDLLPALGAGTAVYLLAFIALERAFAPGDLRFAASLVRRFLRLPSAA